MHLILQLENTIQDVVDTFVGNGKATVVFILPQASLMISNANPSHLKLFVTLMKDLKDYPFMGTFLY